MSDEVSYSEAIQRLEEIVQSLERGGIPLDETLRLYEEGAKLLEFCQQELAAAEGKLNEMKLADIESKLAEQGNNSKGNSTSACYERETLAFTESEGLASVFKMARTTW